MSDSSDKSPQNTDSSESAHNCTDHGHEDHHHGGEEHESNEEMISLAPAIASAQIGLLSKVQVLVDAISEAHVYIPLSEDLPDTPDGEKIEMETDLTFRPHMILNEDHSVYAVAYSDPSLVDAMQKALGWETAGGELKFICAPAHVALDLGQMNLEGEDVSGLVLNPGTEQELILQRDEVASLAQGKALPLVGYVSDLAPGSDEETELVEGAEPPPPELLAALEKAKGENENILDITVHTTFNPERDREPHLSILLTVIASNDVDRQNLADDVMEEAAPHLPAPGYADIIFREAAN